MAKTNESTNKREAKNFRSKGQTKKFYVRKAIEDYIKSEAEIETILKAKFITEGKLKELKEASNKDISEKVSDLYNYITNTKVNNDELESLLNSIEE